MIENMMSREYDLGVERFIQFGLSHAKGSNLIRCSCLNCVNRLLKDVSNNSVSNSSVSFVCPRH